LFIKIIKFLFTYSKLILINQNLRIKNLILRNILITRIKNNNEIIQNFVITENIKRISSVKVIDVGNALYQWFLSKRINHRVVNDE